MESVHNVTRHSQWSTRRVTLICGPPGSGKSTLAREMHGTVVELEDFDGRAESQRGRSKLFGRAVHRVGKRSDADVAVVRCAPSVDERQRFEAMCRPSMTIVLLTPAELCRERVAARVSVRDGALAGVDEGWRVWDGDVSSG